MDRIYSGGSVWRRLLMPLVGPFHELVLLVFCRQTVVASFGLHQVLVPKPAPPPLQCTFELYPFAFELISVHGVFLLCGLVKNSRGQLARSRGTIQLDSWDYKEAAGGSTCDGLAV